jgi:hypothetical protein
MVAEAEIICQQTISMLDVKYHLCVAQEHNVKVEISPTSPTPSLPIFAHVRVPLILLLYFSIQFLCFSIFFTFWFVFPFNSITYLVCFIWLKNWFFCYPFRLLVEAYNLKLLGFIG